jgi:hypothetical protein
MKYLINISFVISAFTLNGQNLVKNSGFEDYWKMQKTLAYQSDTFFCKNWFLTGKTTVDYYIKENKLKINDSLILDVLNVPNNFFGYHPSIEGSGYIGLIPLSTNGEMEHIVGVLEDELVKGKKYEVSFYIKHGGDSVQYSATKFETKFFNESDFFKDKTPFNTKHVIDMFSTSYKGIFQESKIVADIEYDLCQVNDANNSWIKIIGTYLAKGGEKYIGLGLFYQGEKLEILIDKYKKKQNEKQFLKSQSIIKRNITYTEPKLPGNKEVSYYFIDDVQVKTLKK